MGVISTFMDLNQIASKYIDQTKGISYAEKGQSSYSFGRQFRIKATTNEPVVDLRRSKLAPLQISKALICLIDLMSISEEIRRPHCFLSRTLPEKALLRASGHEVNTSPNLSQTVTNHREAN